MFEGSAVDDDCCVDEEVDEDDAVVVFEDVVPGDGPELAPLPLDSGFGSEKTPQFASERITPPLRRMSVEDARTILEDGQRPVSRSELDCGLLQDGSGELTPSPP